MKEKKDPTILEDFFPFSFSSFPSTVTYAFPWPIKGKAGHPLKGNQTRTRSTHLTNEPIEPRTDQNTQAHSREVTELLASVHSFHQRLETYPPLDYL